MAVAPLNHTHSKFYLNTNVLSTSSITRLDPKPILKKYDQCHRNTPFIPLYITCSSSKPKPAPLNSTPTLINRITITSHPPHVAPTKLSKAYDVLVEALERQGVTHVFAYPGGASLDIHQTLTFSKSIKTVLPRHEQGGILAAIGYARASGKPGVCISTSGPGATNLITGLADAMMDSVPIVAITGQVPSKMMGTGVFQDVHTTDITRSITKHNFLVMDPNDIPRVVSEAFFIAQTGRPGPVLIDIPKDLQKEVIVPNWMDPIILPGYISKLPKQPDIRALERIVEVILEAKKPVLYVGGGCIDSSKELRRFVELTGIPVASTLMGLGVFPCDNHEMSLGMLGMHGTVSANYAVNHSDLLLAFGVRFDDRVTGKIEAFANRAKIVHIDIDPSEIGKNKQPHISVHSDIKIALQVINDILIERPQEKDHFCNWKYELNKQKLKHSLTYHAYEDDEIIRPQHAIKLLDEITDGNATITTGVGQHQMFAAQYYNFKYPRTWLTSGGMGTMGYGLPAAMGAACAKPGSLIIDIDGDGSFLMNIQELATIRAEDLPVKIMILNNQYLGMVVQLEDTFYEANRAHTYLGNPENEAKLFPDMIKFAEACDIPAMRVTKRSELKEAIRMMVEFPGPYLLDVVVPHEEHVLPMIPSGGTFQDIITERKKDH